MPKVFLTDESRAAEECGVVFPGAAHGAGAARLVRQGAAGENQHEQVLCEQSQATGACQPCEVRRNPGAGARDQALRGRLAAAGRIQGERGEMTDALPMSLRSGDAGHGALGEGSLSARGKGTDV